MQMLKDMITTSGSYLGGGVLQVDSFLNHQIDPNLMYEIGKEFAQRFKDAGITKILTVEASGIAIGIMTGFVMNAPVVFAKKAIAITMQSDEILCSRVHSFTKGIDCDIVVKRKFLSTTDTVLVVDDFLATGEAALGLARIVEKSGAKLAGVGVAIEKGFQNGRKVLLDRDIYVESLVIVDYDDNENIIFK